MIGGRFSSSRLHATLTLVAVLVIGIALGVTLDRFWVMRTLPASPMNSAMLISEMDRRLHLDVAQRDTIANVLRRHQRTVDSAWARVRPSLHAVIDSSQREILGVLRPDQRSAYLAWINSHSMGASGMPRRRQ
ncbi:MAG: hypothetical protein ABI035_00240 [Gemmatimonadaceae bacterium]